MNTIRQSLCFGAFARTKTAQEVIAAAARIGYESIEMLPQEHWPMVRDHGMGIAIIVGHASLPDGLNKTANHPRIESELRENIDLAAENGIPSLITFSGNRHGAGDEVGLANCAEGLSRVQGYAERRGVTLCMELLNSKVDHPEYQCDHTPWGVRLCRMVDSPRVKLLYDIYHMQIMEGDLIRTIDAHHQWIAHYHTAGNPGRRDLDDEQEISYPAVMRAIARSGYTGFVGHEYTPRGDAVDSMRATFDTCNVQA
ncbi:MAG: TIM barrel protein [bacterium]|nr:TIM barrel protein [bacterium]